MILFIALGVEADFVVIVFKSFIYVWYELPISTLCISISVSRMRFDFFIASFFSVFLSFRFSDNIQFDTTLYSGNYL